jgi:uncharacterized membrane protein YhiD involved in acid resistance
MLAQAQVLSNAEMDMFAWKNAKASLKREAIAVIDLVGRLSDGMAIIEGEDALGLIEGVNDAILERECKSRLYITRVAPPLA